MESKPTRRRLPPEERRALILDAALGLFETQHYSMVSVRSIAAACGVNTALIYHYFEDKDDLVRAALVHAIDSYMTEFSATPVDPSHPLREGAAWIEVNMRIAPMVLRMVKLMGDYASGTNHPDAGTEAIAGFYAREHQVIAGAIRQGIAEGRFRAVDADRTARLASLTLDGIFYAATSRADRLLDEHVTDMLAQLLDYLQMRPEA